MQRLAFFAFLLSTVAQGAVSVLDPMQFERDRPRYQIVDARERVEFLKGHVPESRSLPWKEFVEEAPGLWSWALGHSPKWGLVDTSPSVQERLRAMGLSSTKPIAVLGSPDDVGAEGRAAWNLLYWGASLVSLVDGGFPAWSKLAGVHPEKGEVRPALAPGDFNVQLQPARRARLSDVEAALRDTNRSLLDARTEKEFRGETLRGQKRGGHLPRAQLVPITFLYRTDGTFVSVADLKGGLKGLNKPLTYCTGGVRSSLLAVLIEAHLGLVPANYDGSMWEYSAKAELPLVQ